MKSFKEFVSEDVEAAKLKDKFSSDSQELYNFVKEKIEEDYDSKYVVKTPAVPAEDLLSGDDYDIEESDIDSLVAEISRILSEGDTAILVNYIDGNEWYAVEANAAILNDEEFREIFSDIEETGITNLFFAYE